MKIVRENPQNYGGYSFRSDDVLRVVAMFGQGQFWGVSPEQQSLFGIEEIWCFSVYQHLSNKKLRLPVVYLYLIFTENSLQIHMVRFCRFPENNHQT